MKHPYFLKGSSRQSFLHDGDLSSEQSYASFMSEIQIELKRMRCPFIPVAKPYPKDFAHLGASSISDRYLDGLGDNIELRLGANPDSGGDSYLAAVETYEAKSLAIVMSENRVLSEVLSITRGESTTLLFPIKENWLQALRFVSQSGDVMAIYKGKGFATPIVENGIKWAIKSQFSTKSRIESMGLLFPEEWEIQCMKGGKWIPWEVYS